ncbi:hypothetical protein TSOC_007774 [Tetrabaena socialis]|uniref:Pherophorin domain-containing protein n=1 Tax=Tetrabaena socialis TaxID=47790 RepID=A0A2J8A087_9CHLO|nr:hypothetical protein TSOC_007774 [Tetrabaena socialis]|eukprot:PNH05930.1 hypothetical protein TSOC_007774 [Tetrabaena socialis]
MSGTACWHDRGVEPRENSRSAKALPQRATTCADGSLHMAAANVLMVLISQTLASTSATSTGARKLLQMPASGFPHCSCSSYECGCSPYSLEMEEVTMTLASQPSDAMTKTCFAVRARECDASRACCRGLKASVEKLFLETVAVCQKPNISRVELNGLTSGFQWETKEFETAAQKPGHGASSSFVLRLYNLRSNATAFTGSRICVWSGHGCGTRAPLCGTGPGGTCRWVR